MSSMLGGQHVPDRFASFVHERTGGVPLALEESVRLMADRADLARRNGKWIRLPLEEIAVPPTVRDAVLERAGRLRLDAQAVLRAAAVLADPSAEAVLANVAGLSTHRARAGLREALGSGLLAEDGGLVSFRHALAGRAVYEAILAPDRRVIHLRAGQALESRMPQPVARLARHFREAGETPKWLRYGEQAADLALAAGEEVTAVNLICDLIANADLPAEGVARIMRKIPSLMWLAEAPQGQRLVRALRDVLDRQLLEPGEEAEIRVQLGRALLAVNEHESAGVELERAIPGLAHDPGEAARAMILLGYPDGSSWPVARHLKWLDRAAALPAPARPAERLAITGRRITALLRLGEEAAWTEAAEIPDQSPTREEGLELARAHLTLGDLAMRWGRYAESRRWLAQALKLAESHGYRLLRNAFIVVTQIHLDWCTGAWEGLGDRAHAASEEDGMPAEGRLEALLVVALVQAAVGPADHAEQRLGSVLEDATRLRMVDESFGAAAALARLRLAAGHHEEALEITDLPINVVTSKGIWVWATDIAPVRIEALLAAGRVGSAQEMVTAFGRGLHGRNAPSARTALQLCRALLAAAAGSQDEAASLFAATADTWATLPRPYDALLARERQAACLLAAGQSEAGASLLTEVLRGLSVLGAAADADRVARRLRQHGRGVPRVWLGGRRGYGDQLSPRELDVVRLVAAGHTTREIARQLYRSTDTVYTQLRSAMRKLGVSSRAALVARAAEAGRNANTQPPEYQRER